MVPTRSELRYICNEVAKLVYAYTNAGTVTLTVRAEGSFGFWVRKDPEEWDVENIVGTFNFGASVAEIRSAVLHSVNGIRQFKPPKKDRSARYLRILTLAKHIAYRDGEWWLMNKCVTRMVDMLERMGLIDIRGTSLSLTRRGEATLLEIGSV